MARNELYDSVETSASLDALDVLAKELPKPLILLGGWAVYFSVNERYQTQHGEPYLGSRDVDLGFHVPENASELDIITGNFQPSLLILKRLGYRKEGSSRLCKIINKETGEMVLKNMKTAASEEDYFYLFIDPLVDNSHPLLEELCDITPLVEPALKDALRDEKFQTIERSGREIKIPDPEILLEMKLSSLVKRTKTDKKVKDVCDIYALIWHSWKHFTEVTNHLKNTHQEKIDNAHPLFTKEVKDAASHHLGVELETFEGVMDNLFD
jgi:hypothetical protein